MKTCIEVANLAKEFKVYRRKPGLLGAIQYLFTRDFDLVHAVDRVSFTIDRGESVGYIGKNGAGKSTTLKMLTGILVPTSGSVIVDGLVPHKSRKIHAKKIGVVFGHRTHLRWDIPVQESFRLLKAVYEIPQSRYEENLEMFRKLLDLDQLLDLPVRKLSLGQRMRCDLAAAFLHDPMVVFLDEPTIGLDVLVKEQVRAFIRRLNQERGITVMLTTHDLRDIERLCDRIIIIDEGQIIFDGALQKIKMQFGESKVVSFETGRPTDPALVNRLELPRGARIQAREAHVIRIVFDSSDCTASAVIRTVLPHLEVVDISIEETGIEEIVKRLYRGDLQT